MDFHSVFVIVLATLVESVDRKKLRSYPSPQKYLEVDRLMGVWYLQARKPPCSWTGSSDFTNIVNTYSLAPSGHVYIEAAWRSTGRHSGATFNLTQRGHHGVYVLKDPIGDVVSGDHRLVATDYNNFLIDWGCTNTAIDGSCTDPYTSVKTRQMKPHTKTWKLIEDILDSYWKLVLSEMIEVVQDKDNLNVFL